MNRLFAAIEHLVFHSTTMLQYLNNVFQLSLNGDIYHLLPNVNLVFALHHFGLVFKVGC